MKTLLSILFVLITVITSASQNKKEIRTIETDGYGQLWEKIESDYQIIDSLEIKGPISSADFESMWKASYYGRLSGINLLDAKPQNDSIPDFAFYKKSIQEKFVGEFNLPEFTKIKLTQITLPQTLKVIGKGAFSCTPIMTLHLPESLRIIGEGAFSDCENLRCDVLIIPEGIEKIPSNCFARTTLINRIVLPTSIRVIEQCAFMESIGLQEVVMSEGLEIIKEYAFASCLSLQRMILPNSVTQLESNNFMYLQQLRELVLSDAMTIVNLQSPLSELHNLEKLKLPKEAKTISGNVLRWLPSLATVVIPESLKELNAFNVMPNLHRVYALGSSPAITRDNVFEQLPDDATLYVPIGTGNFYRNAQGWKNFPNIIETSDMPNVGISTILTGATSNPNKYDLMGRECSNPQPGMIYIQNGHKYIAH